jgi:hypothetical protein
VDRDEYVREIADLAVLVESGATCVWPCFMKNHSHCFGNGMHEVLKLH